MNLAKLLLRTAKSMPDQPAVALGSKDLHSYRELARRAGALAVQLRDRFRLAPGDRVALFMNNCPQYLEILYAVWQAGLVAVPINNKLHPKEISYILENSGASLLFLSKDALVGDVTAMSLPGLRIVVANSSEYRGLLQDGWQPVVERRSDDPAWLFYTSGTTGKPKGVVITHDNLLVMTLCYFSDVDTVDRNDSILYVAPMSHGAGLYNFPHVLMGARHLIPESGGFDAEEIFRLAGQYGQLSMFAAPTMVRRMVEHCASADEDSSGIKTVVYGGGPMYLSDIRRALDVMGNRFVQIYGQGESPMTITALSRFHIGDAGHPRHLERLASVGIAHSAVEVQVADTAGRALPAGESGEILVRGATVMAAYWQDPAATAKALQNQWLHTGDIGAFDEDGFLTLKDRSKDVIISGGSNIYPREVEEVLLLHPAVAEVSVVGKANSDWGEEVVAFVVLRPGKEVRTEDLDALCLDHIARFKRPKEYRMVDSLPKNNYGKVLKTALREKLA